MKNAFKEKLTAENAKKLTFSLGLVYKTAQY